MAGVTLASPAFGNASSVSAYPFELVAAEQRLGRAPLTTASAASFSTSTQGIGTAGVTFSGLTANNPYAAYFTSGAASTPTYVIFHANSS